MRWISRGLWLGVGALWLGSTASLARSGAHDPTEGTPLRLRVSGPAEVRDARERFDAVMRVELSGNAEADMELLTHSLPQALRELGADLEVLVVQSRFDGFRAELQWRQAFILLHYYELIESVPRPSQSSSREEVLFYKVFHGSSMRAYAGVLEEASELLRAAGDGEGSWAARARLDRARLHD